jgi:DNA-directed RNA polymerase specialized sigma24 family protein
MDQHRLARRWTTFTRGLGSRAASPAPVDDADRIAVWAEVDRLPSRQRQVIYLRYRSDLPHEEIAQVLGITASASRSHATQAMATLRARLSGEIAELGQS